MADDDDNQVGQITDVLSTPLEDLVASVARGVAVAQHAIDRQSIESFKDIYQGDAEHYEAFRRLGYQPTWYRIPEATAQVKVSLSVKRETKADVHGEVKPRARLFAASVDAAYSNTYNYNVAASSSLTFRVVPVPPSPEAGEMRVVPALAGRPWREASALLEERDIAFDAGDPPPAATAKVKATDPGPGEILLRGEVVKISFE